MPKIRAILFDLDGTIRDSAGAILPAIDHAFKANNIAPPGPDQLRPHAHSIRSVHAHLAAEVAFEDFITAYDGKLQELYGAIVLYEGAADLLKSLKDQGYRLAIVSSDRRAQAFLDMSGVISTYFEVVVGGNDTKEHKPSPEPVLLALEKLKLPADQAIMFGDLAADILAGKAAGVLATIGITHGFGGREMLEEAKTDYIIDSLNELPAVIKKIEQT